MVTEDILSIYLSTKSADMAFALSLTAETIFDNVSTAKLP